MITFIKRKQTSIGYRLFSAFLTCTFVFGMIVPPTPVSAQTVPFSPILNLPAIGTMVSVTPSFSPPMVKGITIHPDNPLKFNFLISSGDDRLEGEAFRTQSTTLIKYFLAGLTVPDDELWVNLSPYESNRLISEQFGQTEMGRDMLAQDYILKQLSASLMYPENELGKKFWDRVYAKAYEQYGTTEIPMNTFNKIWIVPENAVVYEHGRTAFVVESHLKVMLEEDYAALNHHSSSNSTAVSKDDEIISGIQSEMIREVLIPEIEKEVNEGEMFTQLRQIYNSVILATWYKDNLRQSLLGQVYVDQGKTKGVNVEDPKVNQEIYDQYLEAFKVGVYSYIKEDYDPATQEIIPRKYFSGGNNISTTAEIRKDVTSVTPVQTAKMSSPVNQVEVDLLEYSRKNAEVLQDAALNVSSPVAKSVDLSYTGLLPEEYENQLAFYLKTRSITTPSETSGLGKAIQTAKKEVGRTRMRVDVEIIENDAEGDQTTFGVVKVKEKGRVKLIYERSYLTELQDGGTKAETGDILTRTQIYLLKEGTEHQKRQAEYNYAKREFPEVMETIIDVQSDVKAIRHNTLSMVSDEFFKTDEIFKQFKIIPISKENKKQAAMLEELGETVLYQMVIAQLNGEINTSRYIRLSEQDPEFTEAQKKGRVSIGTLAYSGNPPTIAHMMVAGLKALFASRSDRFLIQLTRGDFRKKDLLYTFLVRMGISEEIIQEMFGEIITLQPLLRDDRESDEGLNGEEKIIPTIELNALKEYILYNYGAGGDHDFSFVREFKLKPEDLSELVLDHQKLYLELAQKGYISQPKLVDGKLEYKSTVTDEFKAWKSPKDIPNGKGLSEEFIELEEQIFDLLKEFERGRLIFDDITTDNTYYSKRIGIQSIDFTSEVFAQYSSEQKENLEIQFKQDADARYKQLLQLLMKHMPEYIPARQKEYYLGKVLDRSDFNELPEAIDRGKLLKGFLQKKGYVDKDGRITKEFNIFDISSDESKKFMKELEGYLLKTHQKLFTADDVMNIAIAVVNIMIRNQGLFTTSATATEFVKFHSIAKLPRLDSHGKTYLIQQELDVRRARAKALKIERGQQTVRLLLTTRGKTPSDPLRDILNVPVVYNEGLPIDISSTNIRKALVRAIRFKELDLNALIGIPTDVLKMLFRPSENFVKYLRSLVRAEKPVMPVSVWEATPRQDQEIIAKNRQASLLEDLQRIAQIRKDELGGNYSITYEHYRVDELPSDEKVKPEDIDSSVINIWKSLNGKRVGNKPLVTVKYFVLNETEKTTYKSFLFTFDRESTQDPLMPAIIKEFENHFQQSGEKDDSFISKEHKFRNKVQMKEGGVKYNFDDINVIRLEDKNVKAIYYTIQAGAAHTKYTVQENVHQLLLDRITDYLNKKVGIREVVRVQESQEDKNSSPVTQLQKEELSVQNIREILKSGLTNYDSDQELDPRDLQVQSSPVALSKRARMTNGGVEFWLDNVLQETLDKDGLAELKAKLKARTITTMPELKAHLNSLRNDPGIGLNSFNLLNNTIEAWESTITEMESKISEMRASVRHFDDAIKTLPSTVVLTSNKKLKTWLDLREDQLYFEKYDKYFPNVYHFFRLYGGKNNDYRSVRELADTMDKTEIRIGATISGYYDINPVTQSITIDAGFLEFLNGGDKDSRFARSNGSNGRKKLVKALFATVLMDLNGKSRIERTNMEKLLNGKKSSLFTPSQSQLSDMQKLYALQKKIEANDTPEGAEDRYFLSRDDIDLVIADLLHRNKVLDERYLRETLKLQYGYYGTQIRRDDNTLIDLDQNQSEALLSNFYENYTGILIQETRQEESSIEKLKDRIEPTTPIRGMSEAGPDQSKVITQYRLTPNYLKDPAFKGRSFLWDVEVDVSDAVIIGGKSANTGAMFDAEYLMTTPSFFSNGDYFQDILTGNDIVSYTQRLTHRITALEGFLSDHADILNQSVNDFKRDHWNEAVEANFLGVILDELEKGSAREQVRDTLAGLQLIKNDLDAAVAGQYQTLQDYFVDLNETYNPVFKINEQITDIKQRIYTLKKKDGAEQEVEQLRTQQTQLEKQYDETLQEASLKLMAAHQIINIPSQFGDEAAEYYKELAQRLGIKPADLNVGIRSSATEEDGPFASFAGRLSSYFNIAPQPRPDLVEKYDFAKGEIDTDGYWMFNRQWAFNLASKYTKRAIIYAHKVSDQPIFTADDKISTVSQSMVEAENPDEEPAFALTVFSVDQGTGFPIIKIQMTEGQGDIQVAGVGDGDTLFASYSGNDLGHLRGDRTKMFVNTKDHTGRVMVDIPDHIRQHFVNNDEALLRQVVEYYRKTQEFYGPYGFMDFEGTVVKVNGQWKIVSLQARPETVASLRDPDIINQQRLEVTDDAFTAAKKEGHVAPVNFLASIGSAAQGEVKWVLNSADSDAFTGLDGNGLVMEQSDPDAEEGMARARFTLAVRGGELSHTMVVSEENGFSAMTGITDDRGNPISLERLMQMFPDGTKITIDPVRKVILTGYDHEMQLAGKNIDIKELRAANSQDYLPEGYSAKDGWRSSKVPQLALISASRQQGFKMAPLFRSPDIKGIGLQRLEITLASMGAHMKTLLAYDNMIRKEQGNYNPERNGDAMLYRSEQFTSQVLAQYENLARVRDGLPMEGRVGILENEAKIKMLDAYQNLLNMENEKEYDASNILDRQRDANLINEIYQADLIKTVEELIQAYGSGEAYYKTLITESLLAQAETLVAPKVEVTMRAQQIEDVDLRLRVLEIIDQAYERGLGDRRAAKELKEIFKGLAIGEDSDVYRAGSNADLVLQIHNLINRTLRVRLPDEKSDEYSGYAGAELWIHEEENPMMGYRGLEMLLDNPVTLGWSMEAMKAVADKKIIQLEVFAPVPRHPDHVVQWLKRADGVGLTRDVVARGIMTEIPTNVDNIEDFLRTGIDFVSTGNNDLTQGEGAVDRNAQNPQLVKSVTGMSLEVTRANAILNAAVTRENKRRAELHEEECKSGNCGQEASLRAEYAKMLGEQGAHSIAVVPSGLLMAFENISSDDPLPDNLKGLRGLDLDIDPTIAKGYAKVIDYDQINISDIRLVMAAHYRALKYYDELSAKIVDGSEKVSDEEHVFHDQIIDVLKMAGQDWSSMNAGINYYKTMMEKAIESEIIVAKDNGTTLVIGTDDATSTKYRRLIGADRFVEKEANPNYGVNGIVRFLYEDRDFSSIDLDIIKVLSQKYPGVVQIALKKIRGTKQLNESLEFIREKGLENPIGVDVQFGGNIRIINEITQHKDVSFVSITNPRWLTSQQTFRELDNTNGLETTKEDVLYHLRTPVAQIATAAARAEKQFWIHVSIGSLSDLPSSSFIPPRVKDVTVSSPVEKLMSTKDRLKSDIEEANISRTNLTEKLRDLEKSSRLSEEYWVTLLQRSEAEKQIVRAEAGLTRLEKGQYASETPEGQKIEELTEYLITAQESLESIQTNQVGMSVGAMVNREVNSNLEERISGLKTSINNFKDAIEYWTAREAGFVTSSPVGGIDLNPKLLDLQIKRDGNGIPLPLNLQPIESMNIEGFLPVIINVTPVINLPLFLGLDTTPKGDPVKSAGKDTDTVPFDLSFADHYRNKYIRFYSLDPEEIEV